MRSENVMRVAVCFLILAPAPGPSGARAADGVPALPSTPSGAPAPSVPPPEVDYEIGAEDLLEISVFELPDLTRTVRVAGDGSITLPLVGMVPAAGLTHSALENRLKELLQERYLEEPQVSVFVKEYRSKRISVIGAVQSPGTFEMLGVRNLLEAIGHAGGLTREAGSSLFVLRPRPDGGQVRIGIDLGDLFVRGNPALNIDLSPGDVINVPLDQPVQFYVNGAVKSPGRYESRSSVPVTLLQAVTQAGGATNRANERAVLILRRDANGIPLATRCDLKAIKRAKAEDPLLQDGDVIVVPEAWF